MWSPEAEKRLKGGKYEAENLIIGLTDAGSHALHAVFPSLIPLATLVLPEIPLKGMVSDPKSPQNQNCLIYLNPNSQQRNKPDLVVICHYQIPNSRSFAWTQTLFSNIVADRVIILSSFVENDYKSEVHDPQHRLSPPFLRKLQTRNSPQLQRQICPSLESPNIIDNEAAGIVSHCEHRGKVCYLFNTLKETRLGEHNTSLNTLKAFSPVFDWMVSLGILSASVTHGAFETAYKNISRISHQVNNPLFM